MTDNLILGQRRLPAAASLEPSLLAAFQNAETTDLSDLMQQSGIMTPQIASVHADNRRAVGAAITVFVPSGSQEVRREAMASARAGDVLVIAAPGILGSVLGGKLAANLAAKGVAGVVIDGYVRDLDEIRATGLPVFCKGRIPAAAPKVGPGEVNVPISCGGVVVNPGDVIVADHNGVAVIPRAAAEALAKHLER